MGPCLHAALIFNLPFPLDPPGLPLTRRPLPVGSRFASASRLLSHPAHVPCTRPPSIYAPLQSKHAPGQIVNLLRVALEDSVDPATRQVAAISFKNLVKRDWAAEGGCWQAYRCSTAAVHLVSCATHGVGAWLQAALAARRRCPAPGWQRRRHVALTGHLRLMPQLHLAPSFPA